MRSCLCSLAALLLCMAAAAQPKAIRQWANQYVLNVKGLHNAHTGICILDPATGKYWLQYQADKFFMPASNTKIFTLYTGLQLLGDSLPGMRYAENDTAVYIQGTADPSFLHPDFTHQPVMDFLAATDKRIWYQPAVIKNKRFGPGWAWSDYADYYQPELNEWPMYGNVTRIDIKGREYSITPAYFARSASLQFLPDRSEDEVLADRDERENHFTLYMRPSDATARNFEVPFITGSREQLLLRLSDTLHKPVGLLQGPMTAGRLMQSIPADTLFQPMMHRSDNFFAEQILMMCSARKWDTIDTRKVIRYMLDSSLKDLPTAPSWVDGSGLSRYNLFTPQDFVSVLQKLYKTYPKERLYPLFPTGGKGTLRNYYQQLPGRLYAKTGTLSGCVALSGYLVTRSGKTLIFSVLVNNHDTTSTVVRRAVEKFLVRVANGS
ncbi:D-alanyl-D-alanine carboxypeptidase/D-alanyl-D-alanine-endopeptidase [Chitinophaga alhagiae]|uniref:D-alanyl-D-alanine carboxypeptidase/D-alanyl-D-alanine-endopeptidase n=1 Tax=Chitinophaga alhagiae TaxID=2203219 RepID=A0ABN5LQA2_9BACT|nr:D-alanyl-D-alanine carboxypeptidase [Chitinophaga alhagiae]AWO01581.1 D-alanyl-D-alanine carboxypeptidase/D-alanyl-D-alanine-endopeptidase [Chitinophaga alhagiae]